MSELVSITNAERRNKPPKIETDDAVALLFAQRHAQSLRYVAAWNRWLHFDGNGWTTDQTRHAFDLVRDLCRELVQAKHGSRKTLEAAKKINAVHTLAQADRRIAAESEHWDMDPDVLNEGDVI